MAKIGHEASLFDNAVPGPQPELPAELLSTPADGSLPPPERSGDAPGAAQERFPIPESIRPLVEAQSGAQSREIDRIDDQGQTTGIGNRDRAGIEAAEDIDSKAIESARRTLAKNPRSKPQRSRRGLGRIGRLNADGPPPGVSDARKTY